MKIFEIRIPGMSVIERLGALRAAGEAMLLTKNKGGVAKVVTEYIGENGLKNWRVMGVWVDGAQTVGHPPSEWE